MIGFYVVGVIAYDAKNILTLLYFNMIPIPELREPLKIHIWSAVVRNAPHANFQMFPYVIDICNRDDTLLAWEIWGVSRLQNSSSAEPV